MGWNFEYTFDLHDRTQALGEEKTFGLTHPLFRNGQKKKE